MTRSECVRPVQRVTQGARTAGCAATWATASMELANVDVSLGRPVAEQQAAQDIPGTRGCHNIDADEPGPVIHTQPPLSPFTARVCLALFA